MQAYNVPTGNRRCFVCLFHRKERSDERSTYMTVIIDYGAGNIKSVEKALLSLGQEVVITDDADTILNAERIILPGVGAFGNAMAQLEKTGLMK